MLPSLLSGAVVRRGASRVRAGDDDGVGFGLGVAACWVRGGLARGLGCFVFGGVFGGFGGLDFAREPVDAVPQAGAEDGENTKVNRGGGYEEDEEEELEGAEGGVGRDEEGRCWAWGEDGLPEVDEEGRHGAVWCEREVRRWVIAERVSSDWRRRKGEWCCEELEVVVF